VADFLRRMRNGKKKKKFELWCCQGGRDHFGLPPQTFLGRKRRGGKGERHATTLRGGKGGEERRETAEKERTSHHATELHKIQNHTGSTTQR